jgi:hypothetical protein
MKNQIIIRTTPAYNQYAKNMLNNKDTFKKVPSSVMERLPEMIDPPAHYSQKENFPNCCEWHKTSSEIFNKKWSDFPECCEHHHKLKTQNWFDKESYSNLGEQSFLKLSYTISHIETVQDNEDGLDDSLEYIYYVVWSFGQLPDNFGAPILLSDYLSSLLNYLKETSNRIVYRNEIIKYIEEDLSNIKTEDNHAPSNDFDFNVLREKYNEWVSIFPFDLSIFSDYKEHFQSIFPILSQKDIKYNRYLKLSMTKILSKNELVTYLANLSNNLLFHINAYMLYNKGIFSNQSNYDLELIQENRSLELAEITLKENDSKTEYIKILKKWIAGERKYISEIKEFFHNDNAFLFHKEIDHLFDPNSIAFQNKTKKYLKVTITEDNFEKYKILLPKIKIGTTINILPEPKDFDEAWEMFVDIDAQYALEALQRDYFNKYKRLDITYIDLELKEINSFIEYANSQFDTTTFRDHINEDHVDEYINYLRLTNGYFTSRFIPSNNGNLSGVYGRFVLFRDWLLEEKSQLGDISLKEEFVKKEYKTFESITLKGDWKELLLKLSLVDPPLIDKDLKYIGRSKKDKGVVCSWISYLQTKGFILNNISRRDLASILNITILNFELGAEGRTLGNNSYHFEDNYKQQLIDLM